MTHEAGRQAGRHKHCVIEQRKNEEGNLDETHLARCDVVMSDAIQPCHKFASHVSTDEKREQDFHAEEGVDKEINIRRWCALCAQKQRQQPPARVEQP